MKKKIFLSLVVFAFMTVMSLVLIPKTYAAGSFSDDGWIYDSSTGTYTITKEDADVDTSGWSADGIPEDPFYLKLNNYATELSYYARAMFISTEETAVETVEGGKVCMGIVPFYQDSGNWVVVYMNWDNSFSSTSMSNIHVNGQVNGQWFDKDFWIHDNSNYSDLHVNSNDHEFNLLCRVYNQKLLVEIDDTTPIEFDLSDSNIIMSDAYGNINSMIGIYGYGSAIKSYYLSGSDNTIDMTYVARKGVREVTQEFAFGFDDIITQDNLFNGAVGTLLGWECDSFSSETIPVSSNVTNKIFQPSEYTLYAVWEESEELVYTSSEYLEYGESKYQEGVNSVDVTSDNQSAIEEYLANNSSYTEEQYLAYGNTKYQEGRIHSLKDAYYDFYIAFDFELNESLDIMTNEDFYNSTLSLDEYLIEFDKMIDSAYDHKRFLALRYIELNEYYSSSEYSEYGSTKYQEGYTVGRESVDITLDNEQAALDYIAENGYHSDEEYVSYGQTTWNSGYELGVNDGGAIAYHDSYIRIYDLLQFDTYSEKYDLLTPEEVGALNSSDERKNEFIKIIDEIPEQLEFLNSLDNEELGSLKYQEGVESVDITSDNQTAIDSYIEENNYHSGSEYLEYGEIKYQEGVESVDITSDNQTAIDSYIANNNYHSDGEYLEYGESKYQEGVESVDITIDNQSAIDTYIAENNYHTDNEYLEYGSTKYQTGYTAGVNSVDITTDNDQVIQDAIGYYKSHGYLYSSSDYEEYGRQQYNAGVNSVDVTSDNQTAIDTYIAENNYHSDGEYLEYGETKYQKGVESVDITTDNQTAIDTYIAENNYYTHEEYLSYGQQSNDSGYYLGCIAGKDYFSDELIKAMTGESTDEDVLFYHDSIFEKGYTSGLNSVDITSDNQTAIDTYIANNNIYSEEQYLEYGQLNYETGFADAGGIINDNNVSDSNDDVLGDDDSFESIDYIVLITLFILFLGVLVFIIKAIINAKKNSSKNKYYSSKKRKARR